MQAHLRVDVVSTQPQMFHSPLDGGVVGRACQAGLIQIHFWNPESFLQPGERVDDHAYGGGGMLLRAEPLLRAVDAAQAAGEQEGYPHGRVVVLSPRGPQLKHEISCEYAQASHLILVCGRYEGVDARFVQKVADETLSVGEYVLSGGELAAMVVLDVVARQIPGVIAEKEAASDQDPQGHRGGDAYTRPRVWQGLGIPQALLSGDHALSQKWRDEEARRVRTPSC